MKMKEEENIASYLLWADGISNTIKGLSEKVDEWVIVQKMLRSLPLWFDAKRKDLDSLTMDEPHGIVTSSEMRIGNENTTREEAYKVSRGTKNKKH